MTSTSAQYSTSYVLIIYAPTTLEIGAWKDGMVLHHFLTVNWLQTSDLFVVYHFFSGIFVRVFDLYYSEEEISNAKNTPTNILEKKWHTTNKR